MSDRLLIALQFYHGDDLQANRLAGLISDIQPAHSEIADFLLVCRYDHSIDTKMVHRLARKFNVRTHKCRRQATGWPWGCNEIAFDTFTLAYENIKAKKWPQYSAITMLESDDCPLSRNWVTRLREEWIRRPAGTKCMGDVVPKPGEHLNGNAVFSADLEFLGAIRKIGSCPPNQGWDYFLSPFFRKWGWYKTPLIESWWKTPTADLRSLREARERGCVMLHGIKDGSAVNLVRRNPDDFP